MAEDKNLGYGRVGAVAWIRRFWTNEDKPDEVLAAPYMVGSRFAISEADARRLWGWRGADEAAPAVDAVAKAADDLPKSPETWAELVPYHKANPGHAWTVALKYIVFKEKTRRTDASHTSVSKAMAKELGVTVSMLNTLIRERDEIGSRKAVANRRTGTK